MPIKLIGIGDNGAQGLHPQLIEWIESAEVLVGGERVLSFFPNFNGEKILLKTKVMSVIEKLENRNQNIVILASGDPLFYGIGGLISKKLPVEIYPYVSSIQLAAAKFGISWQDAYFVSIHGRPIKGLAQKIDGKDKVIILTDENNSPNNLASYLIEFGMTEYEAYIAENLQGEKERCRKMTLEEMKRASFSPLNVVILVKIQQTKNWSLGIDDEEFYQRKPEKGLITKKEVRVLSISALNLHEKSIVWDIGTCTGSVAIEAGKIAKEGKIFAIEKNEEDIKNCLLNQQKFRVDFTVVHGKAPEGLDKFPNPDAIFIGGTGGNMEELLTVCCERLNKNGRIVLNAATIENLYESIKIFYKLGFHTEVTQVQIARSKQILSLTRFAPLNPVFIVSAKRKEDEDV
ncbi:MULTISPECIES: precorrin-6y C5,15-methyltransferase (decarboxylating) subunit CbiE [Ureibacillus]|jgi:precorrin-6Y C5,15-methyltransferase (decarboxylating)|uniref:precorrin-6y C5,15-methyltransferase (decarboxylating) subunit CbiE n=1 Tax=Ureibacillus TaxID=160795 RepID=UPI00030074B4|nr:precorrin-6y C5,15-methyltransferase (decarboxylating) subunit CbiE [Ureibacillus thermosphaericus]